jgi:protein-L-isoaspartate(D-aspartate) O-methyltransferase
MWRETIWQSPAVSILNYENTMGSKKDFLKLLKDNKIRKNVINSFDSIDQEKFFDPIFEKKLYTDETIPIGKGQNSDPPLALARMLHYLTSKKSSRILEIGTGSGYSTALISPLADEIITIEYHEPLARAAKERLTHLHCTNIRFFAGEGTNIDEPLGLFDAIIIFAACRKRPLSLSSNLQSGGTIIFPMGPFHQQQIAVLEKIPHEEGEAIYETHFYELCTFTPIIGLYGLH